MAIDINNMSLEQLKEYESLLLEEQRLQKQLIASQQKKSEVIAKKSPSYRRQFISPEGPRMWLDTETHKPYSSEMVGAIAKEAPQEIGGELGEFIGGKAGAAFGPGGYFAGRVIGGGLGGAIAKSIEMDIREKITKKPIPFKQRLSATGLAFLEESGAVGIGEAVSLGAKKLYAPFRGKLTSNSTRMIELAQRYGKYPTPGEILDSWAADTLETISEASFFGGRRMKIHSLRDIPEVAEKESERILRMFGTNIKIAGRTQRISKEFSRAVAENLDPDQIAKLVDYTLLDKKWAMDKIFSRAYKHLDNISADIVVDIPGFHSFATKHKDEIAEMFGIGSTEAGDSLTKAAMKIGNVPLDDNEILEMMDAVLMGDGLPTRKAKPQISFTTARKLSTRLRLEEDTGLARQLNKILHQEMERAALRQNPRVAQYWLKLQDMYKTEMAEKFNDEIIQGLIKTLRDKGEPEKAIPYVFRNKGLSRVNKVKGLLGEDSAAWRALKAAYVQDLFEAPVGRVIGSQIPQKMKRMGDPTINAIFSTHEKKFLETVGEWANIRRGAKEMATGGSMVMQLVQGGAILGIFSGKFRQIATPVFLVPEVISQLATRKQSAEWLTKGFTTSAKTSEGVALAARIMNAVRKAQRDIAAEKRIRAGETRAIKTPARGVSTYHY